jgi:hypothetical protein
LLQTFNHWGKCASESDFADFLGKVDQLRGEHEHSYRDFRMASETLAGLALQRLAYIARRANPAPPGADEAVEVVAEYYAAQGFADLVHGDHVSRETSDTVDTANDRIAEDARVLHEDLRTRVIEGASRAAIVRRYAARCEAFDAERLRGLAAGDSKNAERSLTLDFAAYLFDQGFNPLIDATVAGLRPDVVDPQPTSLFYVEAKQYNKDHPRADIARGIRQVWVTWGRLRQRYPVPEAFVLVFRRSGPLVVSRSVSYDGRRMHLVVVDITLSEETGSKEYYQPISFSDAELLPDRGT